MSDSLKALSQLFALLLNLACEKHKVEKINYKLQKKKKNIWKIHFEIREKTTEIQINKIHTAQ